MGLLGVWKPGKHVYHLCVNLSMSRDVFIWFVDVEKAFDRAQYEKMIKLLKITGIDHKELRCIANLNWQIEENKTDDLSIKSRVRKSYVLSPFIFNLYSKKYFRKL